MLPHTMSPMVFLRLFVIESSFHFQPTAIEVDPIAQSKRPNRSSAVIRTSESCDTTTLIKTTKDKKKKSMKTKGHWQGKLSLR